MPRTLFGPSSRSRRPGAAWWLAAAAAIAVAIAAAPPVRAQDGDALVVQAREALRTQDRARLVAARQAVAAIEHPLAMWVDYWELGNRLAEARQDELDAFYARWSGSYVEDRLRNDWLLELGKRRDWANFRAEYPRFRMNDDREVLCYALLTRHLDGQAVRDAARDAWLAQRDLDDGCQLLAATLLEAKVLEAADVWHKVRLALELNRSAAARGAAALIDTGSARSVAALIDDPLRWLTRRPGPPSSLGHTLDLLALVRLASTDAEQAARLLDERWTERLPHSLAATAWAHVSKQSALRQLPQAAAQARNAWRLWDEATRQQAARPPWSDDLLGWQVRAALREADGGAARWQLVQRAIDAMADGDANDGAWVYWRARATLALAAPGEKGDLQRAQARQALASIAPQLGFYGRLAAEDLDAVPPLPAPPPKPSADEREAAQRHPGLTRALHLLGLGLRSEGVREWNFSLRGMAERELLAAAQRACEREVWDRCINTSDRTKTQIDLAQRYPLPFRDELTAQARDSGVDPALLYGLIRQESRFITDVRSHVGASGLMQLMPATARWTARRIGLAYKPSMINDPGVNLRLGTSYFKLVLDDFDGSLAMAAAAYNAGPNRPRRWRDGPVVEAAAWAESIPFAETRDYVKKVLTNSIVYAARLGGEVPTLKSRLGPPIGPRAAGAPVEKDLP